MIQEASGELEKLELQVNELISMQEKKVNLKTEAINSLDIINGIIQNGDISRRDLERLVKRITIKQLSKPKRNVKPILNIDIEWDVFISSAYNIIDIYNNNTEYTLPWG